MINGKNRRYQKQFKSDLKEVTTGNTNNKSEDQLHIQNLIKIQENKLSNYIMIMLRLDLKICTKQKMKQDLKY